VTGGPQIVAFVELDEVRVRKSFEGAELALQLIETIGVEVAERLEGDIAFELRVGCAEHETDGARAEELTDTKAFSEQKVTGRDAGFAVISHRRPRPSCEVRPSSRRSTYGCVGRHQRLRGRRCHGSPSRVSVTRSLCPACAARNRT